MYFKTNDPQVIYANRRFHADVEVAQTAGRAFAAHYPNAKAQFRSDIHGFEFYGLVFTPALRDPLWTKPGAATGYVQRPRTAPEKCSRGDARRQQIAALAGLNTQWLERLPTGKADREPFFNALGLSWGDLVFGGRFSCFEREGFLFFETTCSSQDSWVEILGSDYHLAKALHERAEIRAEMHADQSQQDAA